jgi:cysteine desulfurase
MRRIYLDYNATTPMADEVREAMMEILKTEHGNPSSLHQDGQKARFMIESARESLAGRIGASPDEIVFVSGGTEANNLALKGVMRQKLGEEKKHLIISAIEHPSIKAAAQSLEAEGVEVSILGVRNTGEVDVLSLEKLIRPDTALLSVMHVNNETGVVQPLGAISHIVKKHNLLFHVDAVQSFGKIPFSVQGLGCDLLSLSAHKIYGPKGCGLLFVRKGVKIQALCHGGSQEKNLRPGTENVSGIIGFSAASDFVMHHRDADFDRLKLFKTKLIDELSRHIKGIAFHGENTLPHTVNFSIEGIEGQMLVMNLDLEGMQISTGSACSSGTHQASHVLLAMGLDESQARSAIRISMGHQTQQPDVDQFLKTLPRVVNRLQDVDRHPLPSQL